MNTQEKADDIEAIVKAHEYANAHRLPARAKDDATYYISGRALIDDSRFPEDERFYQGVKVTIED